MSGLVKNNLRDDPDHKYVFIIGAAKCGTTALADFLDQHSKICLSSPKESDFFTRAVYERGLDWYEERFAHNSAAPFRVDASVSYSAGWNGGSTDIAARIAEFSKHALLIYLVRDPIERSRASYWHAKRSGYEKHDFTSAMLKSDSDHISASMYNARINDYLKYFDESSLKVISQQSLLTDPQQVVGNIFDWIGIDSIDVVGGTVNATYKLSFFGKVVNKIFSKPFRKRLAKLTRVALPACMREALMKFYSSPIPELNKTEGALLRDILKEDIDRFVKKTQIEVRTSKWWVENENSQDRTGIS